MFRDGILLFSEAGAIPASGLEQLISKVRELDMDQVRRDVEDIKKKDAVEQKK